MHSTLFESIHRFSFIYYLSSMSFFEFPLCLRLYSHVHALFWTICLPCWVGQDCSHLISQLRYSGWSLLKSASIVHSDRSCLALASKSFTSFLSSAFQSTFSSTDVGPTAALFIFWWAKLWSFSTLFSPSIFIFNTIELSWYALHFLFYRSFWLYPHCICILNVPTFISELLPNFIP